MLRRLPALNALKENAAGNRAAEHLIARPAQRHEVQQQVGVVIEARGQRCGTSGDLLGPIADPEVTDVPIPDVRRICKHYGAVGRCLSASEIPRPPSSPSRLFRWCYFA